MPKYYSQRQKNLYDPKSKEPFRISRSKMELFLECPRCFYLDRKLGLKRPEGPGFTLNDAVDHLLKNEFDLLRKNGQKHLLMDEYHIDAVPFSHPDLPEWRDDHHHFIGASIIHKKTNLEICGIIDDLWINSKGELHIVDYKTTSTSKKITLEDEYKQDYKKQVEWYQWIFRQKGFKVSNTAYFVFANGLKGERIFDGKLEFKLEIIPHEGSDLWVEETIYKIKETLDLNEIPESNLECHYCKYRSLINQYEK